MTPEQKKAHDRLGLTLKSRRYMNTEKGPLNRISYLEVVIKCKCCGENDPRKFYEGDKTVCKNCKRSGMENYKFGFWDR